MLQPWIEMDILYHSKNSQNALDLKFVSEFICDFSYENTIKLKGVYSYSLEQGTYLCKNIFFEGTYVENLRHFPRVFH